jgi:glyoxylase-like metal-dependent hydrolase (beta-lactamase superfamily II)
MISRLTLAVALLLVMVGVYVRAQQAPQPAALDMVTVADDLYVIHNEFVPGNVAALVTDEGVVLVDDKFAIDYDNIMQMLRTVTDQPVRYVINTHHHGDHTGGNEQMQAMGVQVIASEQARRYMASGNLPGPPTVTFDDRAFVHLGGKRIELYYFGRAHTSGDTFVYFPEHRVLATGDAFTEGRATPQLVDYQGGGSAREWPATLDAALRLDFDTVIPGHGNVTDKAGMLAFRDNAAQLITGVQQMMADGRTPEEIGAALQSDFGGAQMVFPGAIDGLLVELR